MSFEFSRVNQLPDTEEGYRPHQYWEDTLYQLRVTRGVAQVHTNEVSLWREDNRYPGAWLFSRYKPGIVKIQPVALRHGAKDPKPIYLDQRGIDKTIHTLMALRSWNENSS